MPMVTESGKKHKLNVRMNRKREADMSLNFISPADVYEYTRHRPVLLIDIRDEAAYRRGHIPGAVNMPFGTFDLSSPRLSGYAAIVLCCDRGSASLTLGRRLARMGYRVLSVGGGMESYRGILEKS